MSVYELIDRLEAQNSLETSEYLALLNSLDTQSETYLFHRARSVADAVYGKKIYIRGLIEISNYCKNNCCYCGIRRGNHAAARYRLTKDEILACCERGHAAGFRTFVLQGGEDAWFTDEIVSEIVHEIKAKFPDCAVTLSLGEKPRETYKAWREAGADRYLLRHESINPAHYALLHPAEMSIATRRECLENLKSLGYQTGCGIMVGSPYQTMENIAEDLKFMEEFAPHMVGLGPFIPHRETPFASCPAGSVELTLRLLAIVRLQNPRVLLPATTALNSLDPEGRIKGVAAGANVVMPNLSPEDVRAKYTLYDHKAYTACESAQQLEKLRRMFAEIGYEIEIGRGDSLL